MNGASVVADSLAWRWFGFGGWPPALLYEALRLRSAVFVVEQNCVFADMDGLDPDCEHLCGVAADGSLLAYARLLPPGLKYAEASIGRVVTAGAVRRTGLGRQLMRQALDGCRARYPGQPVRIGAQQRLERFYADFGFAVAGPPYLEDGIWHVEMVAPAG
ncbi:MAG: GNAT family N-acetyltransferase [Nevskia sp.]|nr:GNAT family N-acetyltransferase [Nevskia sp.]